MHTAVDDALASVKTLRTMLKRSRSAQVTAQDECSLVKATALAWFQNQRPVLQPVSATLDLTSVDTSFRRLLESADRRTRRTSYETLLKSLVLELVGLRSEVLTLATQPAQVGPTNVHPPSFSPLASDPEMQRILTRRWREAGLCVSAKAPLAAIVMMGGLLEGLLVARVNLMPNKAPAFKAKSSPKDRNGKTLPVKEWTLNNYLEIAHELGWIGKPTRDIGAVLREYRNFIHPAKELSAGISLTDNDSAMLWSVFSTVAQQILASAQNP